VVKVHEKSTEEKLREYVWLHADESIRKIQTGIMEEFGETRSLKWISKERQEYLAADETPTDENSLSESSIDDESIQAVAESFPNVAQNQIREIIKLKTTTRLGYRRIGRKLNPPLGKDTVMRIWKMRQVTGKPLKSPELTREEEELEKLRAQVAEKERLKRLQEEKEELLRKDLLLSLQTERDNLILHIVENEVAKLDPEVYQEFKRYCEYKRLSPKAALQQIGLTAAPLIDNFDNWYDWFYKHGSSGMQCLACAVWSGLFQSLSAFVEQRAAGESEGKEHGEETIPELSDEEYEKIGWMFAECSKRKATKHISGASLTKNKPQNV